MDLLLTTLLAGSVLGLLAVGMGYGLGWANRRFHVETDPRVRAIDEALPGANCGGCGYVGCMEYAEAVAKGEAVVTLCGPGGESCSNRLAEIMGVELTETWPYKAVVHCAADRSQRKQLMNYSGEQTCAAANLVAGYQGCTFGCLGLGDCVRACEYDAIHSINGLAVVDYDKCTGCRACEKVCPRNIITMVPFKSREVLVVACSNQDTGPAVKEVCEVGCIGCKACIKQSGGLMEMKGTLPELDYSAYQPDTDLQPAVEKCPMESLVFVGNPDRNRVHAGEPEKIRASFKSTVDKTEWWG